VRNDDLDEGWDDAQKLRCLCPIHSGDNGYEYVDDEYEYYHDFNSYYKFINRLPALRRLMDRGEWVGSDIGHPIFAP
jgi:hypothetical protein